MAAGNRAVRRNEVNGLFRDTDEHPRRLRVVPLKLASQYPAPSEPARAIQDREPQAHGMLMAGGHADVAKDGGRDTAAHLDRCLELLLITRGEVFRGDNLVRRRDRAVGVFIAEPGAERI